MRLAILVVVGMVVVGCDATIQQPISGACSETCSGCCLPDGACIPGNADDQCGTAGAACQDCPTQTACSSGTCTEAVIVNPPPGDPGNSDTCPGGCFGTQDCVQGTCQEVRIVDLTWNFVATQSNCGDTLGTCTTNIRMLASSWDHLESSYTGCSIVHATNGFGVSVICHNCTEDQQDLCNAPAEKITCSASPAYTDTAHCSWSPPL